ncbi:hypothetical protein Bca52824_042739 [Brassica carinata]|uniref:Uncharacterized protein n=1 Tax=Brassica carinata TaxID=52824 RepID=A0A8X7UXL8_BRACI|nr:hypothetical protein Bca52824_042739 [Brassica carinata]
MGDRDQEKNMENPDTVQKVRGGLGLHQTEWTVLVITPRLCPRDTYLDLAVHNRTASLDTGRLCGWFDSHHGLGGWAKRLLVSDPYGSVYDLLSQDRFTVCLSQGPRPDQVRKSVGPLSRTSIGPVKPRFYPVRQIGLRSDLELFELRMALVKPRSREGLVSERLCNVWLDDARDELVIVYETVKKLCIRSHVSK